MQELAAQLLTQFPECQRYTKQQVNFWKELAWHQTIGHARGLSVKGTWGPNLDPAFDAEKLVRTARAAGYSGWWGIEVAPRRDPAAPKPTPDELFGPFNPSKLIDRVCRLERMTDGYLPTATMAFIDEIWKGSSACLSG